MSIEPVRAALRTVTARHRPGSSIENGKLYHDLPFAGLEGIPSHRLATAGRITQILAEVDVRGRRVLDLGCGPGGISIGLALAGADHVLGVDYDKQALEVARAAAEHLGISSRVRFEHGNLNKALPAGDGWDVVIWLSQWMWMVKQQGRAEALDQLHDVSRRAKVLVFETAADDGEAAIRGTNQGIIAGWLEAAIVHRKIGTIASAGNWFERPVHFCRDPRATWIGSRAAIERVDRKSVTKCYAKSAPDWMPKRESVALQRLDGSSHVPRLLEMIDERTLRIEWAGWPERVQHRMLSQGDRLLADLKDARIRHRDIRPPNLLGINGRLKLIDFEWALFDDEADTPAPGPPELGTMPNGRRFGPGDARALAEIFQDLERR